MQAQRVVPVLRSVAEIRNWVHAHVPFADTLLGYDLFLRLGNDVLAGLPLDSDSLAAGLPYDRSQVDAQLERMAAEGLVEFSHADGKTVVHPTPGFLLLLDTYGRMFERQFIVRSDLRRKQLLLAADDPELLEFAQLLYDRMYDLGWLYLHNYGSACFLIASLVQRIALEHGYDARIISCHVAIDAPGISYKLGAPGMAKAGQIDGHAAVVINEKMIIDFGLGNVRKGYRRDFPWGAAFEYRRDGAVFGALLIEGKELAVWKDDWQSPSTEAELARYAPHMDSMFGQYSERFLA